MPNGWAMRPMVPAALEVTSEAAGYSRDYMLNDHMGVVWKTATGSASHAIKADLGSAQVVDAALFFGCTGAQAGWTLSVNAANSSDMVTDAWSGGTVSFLAGSEFPTHGRGVGYWEAATTPPARRYWRFEVLGLASAALTVARLAIGTRLTLERNFVFGGAWGVRDLGRTDFSPQGVLLRRQAAKLRTLGLSFPHVRKDEAEGKVQPLIELRGSQHPIVLVTDPAANAMRQRRCWFGVLASELGTIWRAPNAWEWRNNLVDLVPIPKDVF